VPSTGALSASNVVAKRKSGPSTCSAVAPTSTLKDDAGVAGIRSRRPNSRRPCASTTANPAVASADAPSVAPSCDRSVRISPAFHPGAAARAGLTSALLAKNGFTASTKAIEAPRGYAQVVSTQCDWDEITEALGKRFEISLNTYKPFACGIVIHPTIDAATQLRAQGVKADDIERVELRVHPLVLELTGKKEPQDGLQGKFSVYHGFAAGLLFGRAGEGEYADGIVTREDVVALRRKVVATPDDSISEASADVTAVMKDGRKAHVRVEHAIGSVERPMSDGDLEGKFHGLADPVIGKARAAALIAACWNLAAAPDVRALVAAARP